MKKKNKKSLNKLSRKFELKREQMVNLDNIDNSISYSIALDEEVGELVNEKNKKDIESTKCNKNKKRKV